MSHRPRHHGFTLVELLVVIGIIALLISMLLPSLNKARQQASLVACQAQLRQIGQALLIYSQTSKNTAPIGRINKIPSADPTVWVNSGQDYGWVDTLSMTLGVAPRATAPNNVLRAAKVFYDRDVNETNPNSFGNDYYGNHYQGNLRFFGRMLTSNPASNEFIRPHKLNIREGQSVMIVWDGAQQMASWATGNAELISEPLGGYQFNWGHGFCYPKTLDAWAQAGTDFNARVAIGGTGSNTMDGLKAMNMDIPASHPSARGSMRFRHMNNTTVNALFADGHVEPRKLGDVKLRDVSMNK